MSNGVGVIVRGHKTAHIGFDKTPILPHRVSNRPITLPPHTVSRQFHLIESPGRPLNNAISHLLHSIVRSATPDLVTKTMLTTFTYLTTVLRHSNTIVKSREETISNVMTQKYHGTMEYTPSVKAEPSSLAPELLASFTGHSSYFINSLTTTYIYYNTFSVDSLPVVLTSRETVTNVVTIPGYMSPTMSDLMVTGSRVFETETYFTTYTFSKTLLLADATSEVVTTKEIITQVVVTEALAPPTTSQVPLNTPMPPGLMDEITKTYLTTFTHLFTEIDENGKVVIRSSTSISSDVVTEKVNALDSRETLGLASMFQIKLTDHPTLTGWFKRPSITMRSPGTLLPTMSVEVQNMKFTTIQPSETIDIEPKTLEPVMIYATKTYYTTYTYFTTLLGDGPKSKPTVHSRTHIVSKVVTEALSTSYDAFYVNALKSSYLSKHSTMIDITSSVREIVPTKIMEPIELPGTLVTESFSYPHWPKDNDELAVEIDRTTLNSVDDVEVPTDPIQAEIQVSSASSEEHFDEIKEEVNHIVNVLTDSEESATSGIMPSATYQEPIYSTVPAYTPESVLKASQTVSNFYNDNGIIYVEQVTYKDPNELHEDNILMESVYPGEKDKPITHIPTPPLVISSSPMQPLTTNKPKTKKPFNPYLITTDLDIFPDIGTPEKSTLIDFPPEVQEYSEEDEHVYSSMLMADRYPAHTSSFLAKRTGTILFEPVSPVFQNPSEQILTLVSKFADHHWSDYEENKDEQEEDIPPPKIYNIHTTFDSFVVPTSELVQVPMQYPSSQIFPSRTKVVIRNSSVNIYNLTAVNHFDGGDMQIHTLASDDLLMDGSGSGSGSGEGPVELDEIAQLGEASGGGEIVEAEIDYREADHTENPDRGEVAEEELEPETESFTPITESPVPPFPPRTRYTTSRRPDKKKKTQKPVFGADLSSREEDSGESSTKVYSLKVPHFDVLAGNADSVSDESDNISDLKKEEGKESEQENDELSSESAERPQDEEFVGPGPSKSSLTYTALGPGLAAAPGTGPVASSTSGIDWKPLLKLGAIGLGGLGATKLAPWFNSMAGTLMKGSVLSLARNDTERERDRDRPIFHRHPPPHYRNRDRDRDRDRPHIEHADPIYIPVRDRDRDHDDSRPIDERIPRRPITSHAKDSNMRPVSLERDRDRERERDRERDRERERDRDRYRNRGPPGRDHDSGAFEMESDSNFPPNNYNFKPPHDRHPNIYSQINELNLHKNGEYSSNDPNLRVINGVPHDIMKHAASGADMQVEGKTEFILRPFQNILNGKPAFEGPPKPGPMIPLRPPFQSGEIAKVQQRPVYRPGEGRPPSPEMTDAFNDIPDSSPIKPIHELPILRPVPPTDGIILPHRVRGEHGTSRFPPADILNSFKRPFMPPPRYHQGSKEEWPKPLHPFRNSEEIINLNPPMPPQSARPNQHSVFDENDIIRAPSYVPKEPAIHMSPPEMSHPFGGDVNPHASQENRPYGQRPPPPHHHYEAEASEEDNVFKDIFGVRVPNDHRGDDSRIPDISFHPHNAGEGPFRPLESTENHQPNHNVDSPSQEGFGRLPVPHPTGIAGQPSNQFGRDEEEPESHEESPENPFQHEFKKMHPSRKPSWPPLNSNSPMSYSYFEDQSAKRPGFSSDGKENEIGSSPSPHQTPPTHNIQNMPAAPPLAFPPTKHTPPHLQRPSTVYIIQQEEMDAPTTTSSTTTPRPSGEPDFGESSMGFTTQFPKLIIKEIPTRPVAPYYRRSTTTSTPGPVNQNPTNRATIAKLFIRRFSTTTTPRPTASEEGETTTNRFVTWRTRLKPTFMTTSAPSREEATTTLEPNSINNTLIDSWLVSPTVNDLQEFLDDFKNKFNLGNNNTNNSFSSGAQGADIILPQRLSSTGTSSTTPKPNYLDDDDLANSSEYDDDDELLDDDMNVGASSERNLTSAAHHPNHHPVHKEPIDANHFFSTGQGDFAQYYSGSEDRDTIIDPVNQKVIKSPFDHRNNVSSIIHRYRATSTSQRPSLIRPIHFRNYSMQSSDDNTGEESVTRHVVYGSTTSLDNDISELPGPTTYRPRFDVTFHNKMGTTSEEPLPPNPTTFRGEMIRPTTFRPGPDDLPPIGSRLRPDPTRDLINNGKPGQDGTKRPAPQEGMASFYDDDESLSQLKVKNQEILKLPGRMKKPNSMIPDVLEAISDEEIWSTERSKMTTSVKSSTEKAVDGDGKKKGEDYDKPDDEIYSEEYDSAYDEDGYIEIPPANPGKTEYNPVVHSGLKNSAEGKQNGQYQNSQIRPPIPPPGQSRKPGPLEMLTNFFRRPATRPGQVPSGPGRIPFVPNSSREPTRTMLPPPLRNSNERPELQFQANNFNPNVKTIPLNPNADKGKGGNKVDDPIVLMPKETTTDNPSVMTTTIAPRESGEKTTIHPSVNVEEEKNDQSPLTSDSNSVTISPNANNNNGIRESTYIEDSEYYEDDEMEEDDKNNVIPPEGDGGPHHTGPPIKFQPTPAPAVNRPPPMGENVRPITIGGHLVNNGHIFRPPTANQRRPPGLLPPGRQPLPPPFGRPQPHFNPPPPPPQNNPEPPRTEMEPPPIDSNRLKAPILELPSSGPIRYRPINNNVHRPNLLHPDDELFKPTTKASKTVHTIASVDDLNKIVATNTFTAIIPTRGSDDIIEAISTSTDTTTTSAPTTTTSDLDPSEVQLEGSESPVSGSQKTTGVNNVRMTSVVKYTGGRLETSEIEAHPTSGESTRTRGTNIIIPTRSSSVQSSSTPSGNLNTRLIGLNRRPPLITRQSTTTSSTESSSTSPPVGNNTSSSSVRVTVTMESSVSSSETDSPTSTNTRKAFIPTRAPTRNTNFPWLRKPAGGLSSEKEETTTTTYPTTNSPTTTETPTTTGGFTPRIRQPSNIPTRESASKEVGFSTTLRSSPNIFNISRNNNNRPDIIRRTTVIPGKFSSTISTAGTRKPFRSSASHESSRVSMEVSSKTSSSTESKERPSLVFPRLTTFKPSSRRPTLSFSSSRSRERFTTALINKVTTTSGTPSPTRNPSIFSGLLTNRNFTSMIRTSITNGTTSTTTEGPLSESSEYEDYTDEEYEDEDFELEGDGSKHNNSSTPTTNVTRDFSTESVMSTVKTSTSTSSSMSVSTSMSVGNESHTITVSSSEINPTKVSNNNNNKPPSNRPKGILNTMVLRGTLTRVPDLPATTKYITHSETETKTLTETETTVVVTAGTPYTHTIMITKTLPPQTLISTIVGSVTLVNTIDVRPTTVRSTIYAQPTKEVYSFVDTSEDMDHEDDNKVIEDKNSNNNNNNKNNKVLLGGALNPGHRPRPPHRSQTPPPNHIPKHDHELATSTKEPKVVRNRPVPNDMGCPANCTHHGNQACRPYANGTKYKCDCKAGYARLKRKFPCRPTYTYELSLAINQMDGMSFDFKDLQNSGTGSYLNFITVSKEAIDKAFLSTDIKRQFQGAEVMKLRPVNAVNERTKSAEPRVYVDFLVQLTANVTEDRIRNHLIRTLKSSNFSVGRTGISSTKNMSDFGARDFNECLYSEFNDCSPNADCLNIRGSFSCRCRPGFRDKSPKKHKPGRDCFEMQGCPECNYKGHCRINAYGEPFCECFRWFGGSKCHINLKVLLFAIMGVVAILFIFVLLCSVLVCRKTKIHRERPGSGRFMRYRSPTSQATLDRAAIMNDSASSDGRQSPPRMNAASFTPDSLLVEGDQKQSNVLRGDSLMGVAPDNVHLMNFSLRNVIMDQDRSLTVVIPRAKIRPPSRPPSIHATLGPDTNADLAASERKLINYLDHSPYPPAPYQSARPPPPTSNSRQSTIKRHDSRQFRKLSLQEQRKISSGALVSSGTEVSARGGMRRRSIGPEPEPTYSGYEKSFSDLRSITDTMRSPAQQQLFSTDTSRTSCYSHSCKPPSYCAYSESVGHTMGDKDGASTVYTTQGKLFRMAQDDTDSTASSQ